MKITEELVDYVSALSRLKLSDGERAAITGELSRILDYMDVLRRIDTTGAEPLSHVLPLCNVLRPDEAAPSLDRGALLALAPVPDEEAFLAPKAVE